MTNRNLNEAQNYTWLTSFNWIVVVQGHALPCGTMCAVVVVASRCSSPNMKKKKNHRTLYMCMLFHSAMDSRLLSLDHASPQFQWRKAFLPPAKLKFSIKCGIRDELLFFSFLLFVAMTSCKWEWAECGKNRGKITAKWIELSWAGMQLHWAPIKDFHLQFANSNM